MIMITIRNNMWKVLLVTGISFFLFFSCEKEDNGSATTYYKFRNTTSQNIEIYIKDKATQVVQTYSLNPNQEKEFLSKCLSVSGGGICEDFTGRNEITIKFITDNICLVNFPKIFDGRLYDNFSTEMYNTNENTLLYLIDAEEVAAATVCN